MRPGNIKLALVTVSLMLFADPVLAAHSDPRTCSAVNATLQQNTFPTGGSGGTGHTNSTPSVELNALELNGKTQHVVPESSGLDQANAESNTGGIGGTGNTSTVPPGGIGGTGIEAAAGSGGIGGTGNTPIIPPGGIGGTGITMAGLVSKASGDVAVIVGNNHKLLLAEGDEVCVGDVVTAGNDGQLKITFSDGASLHVLKNSEISIDDYAYLSSSPKESRSIVSLVKGDIRSVSGAISKINPAQYAIKTPVATINVIGTDFLVTHLPENSQGGLSGTYVKVLTGEVSISSTLSKILLRAGESSHVLLSGIHSIINSSGGTCMP